LIRIPRKMPGVNEVQTAPLPLVYHARYITTSSRMFFIPQFLYYIKQNPGYFSLAYIV